MSEISNEMLQKAKEVLAQKPKVAAMTDFNYLKYKLHIGTVTANNILELLQEVDNAEKL